VDFQEPDTDFPTVTEHDLLIATRFCRLVVQTPELLAYAMQLKHPDLDLHADQRCQAEEDVREELSNVVLFDVLVSGRDARFDVGDFGQDESDQVAYDEHFLSEDGSEVVEEDSVVPSGKSLRVAFFLHFVDPSKPLNTNYGQVAIPPIQPMPARLRNLVPYEPVD
jgi:hypothetical protein